MKGAPGIAILIAGSALLGCGDGRKPEAEPKHDHKPVSADEVKAKAKAALETTGDYLRQQGEQLRVEAERKLQELKPQLEQMKREGRDLSKEASEKARELRSDLERERERIQSQLERIRDEPGEAWEDLRRKLSAALAEIEDRLRDLALSIGSGSPTPVASPTQTPR